jgi:uncharacterized protein YjiS (DUF1127 family)
MKRRRRRQRRAISGMAKMAGDEKLLRDDARASAVSALWSWAIAAPMKWRTQLARQRTFRSLMELEPHRLDDIGLTRQDLEDFRRRL